MNASHASTSSAQTVVVAQVRVGRDQVGLGDPHRRLRAALGLRIGRHARRDRDAVVAADRDHLRMPHRDPATWSIVTVRSLSVSQ
jgi:hypothetical protein